MKIQNFAPDQDAVVITTNDNQVIAIGRDEDGEVTITITPNDGSDDTVIVLGKE